MVGQGQANSKEQASPLDVILTGVYFCDLIFTGLPQMPELGHEIFSARFDILPGGTFNMAYAMQRLGMNVAWQCEFGTDFFSQYVLNEARKAGLDDRFFRVQDKPLRNLTVSLSFADDRAFVTYADMFRPNVGVYSLRSASARCVVLPVFLHQPEILTLSRMVHDQESLLFMDCAQLEVTLDTPGVVEALRAVDIFAPNETEILQLTRANTVDEALDILAPLTPLIVLKRGSKGSVARQGSRTVQSPALEGLEVVDTTGAGDCYNAGFLRGYLYGEPLERCLQLGNIVGGLSTLAHGTQSTPTLAEVERHLRTYYAK